MSQIQGPQSPLIQSGPDYVFVGSDLPKYPRLWKRTIPPAYVTYSEVDGLARLAGNTAPSNHAGFFGFVLLGRIFPDTDGQLTLEAQFRNYVRPSDIAANERHDVGIELWPGRDGPIFVTYGGKSGASQLELHHGSISNAGAMTVVGAFADANVPARFAVGLKVRYAQGTQTAMSMDRIYCVRDGFATLGDTDMGASSLPANAGFEFGVRVAVGLVQVRTSAVSSVDIESLKIVKGFFVPDLTL